MPKSKELTILIAWHKEADKNRIACFEENKQTFELFNPNVNVITILTPFDDFKTAWLNTDLTIFTWYETHKDTIDTERFLLVEWDCWCDISAKEYYQNVWNCDVVVPTVVYPERDTWHSFNSVGCLPDRARLFATGIIPFCGILLSNRAMKAIGEEILKPDYNGLSSELRFPTIATMLGFDPVPNPVCSRAITWTTRVPFNDRFKGLHHPRKTLPDTNVLDGIEKFIVPGTTTIPKIIHQTWKVQQLPENLSMLAESWKVLHPDWHYILWTDEMNREFIKCFFSEFLLQYDSYQENIQRVDAARYFILHKFGGVFIDMDFECLENIESLIKDKECVFALEPEEHCEQFKKDKIICNAFMATKPNHDFLHTVCNSLQSFSWKSDHLINNILSTTGPFALTEIYDTYLNKETVTLLNSDTVYPLSVKETRLAIADEVDDVIQEKIDKAYAVHYFFGSWYNDMQ